MPDMPHRPPDHPAVAIGKVGVVLVNLGSPAAPTPGAVRRYLAEFLSDRRVVELPPLIWKPILHGIILRVRPRRSARLYAHIWDKATDSAPLQAITTAQAAGLAGSWGPQVMVRHAMRYGAPSLASVLDDLRAQGCDRLLLAPLYPQYSSATTGSVLERAFAHLSQARWMPAVRTLPPYYDDPVHIAALASSVKDQLAQLKFKPDVLVASFHGMPRITLTRGDPYHCQCQKTARLLRAALGLSEAEFALGFQSRFGRQEWLRPYTADLMKSLPGRGIRRIAVVAPGFSADCLETREEIVGELATLFRAAGGKDFAYLDCLNASPAGLDMLRRIIGCELSGWLENADNRT